MNIFKFFYYMYYRPKIFLPKKSYSMFGEDIFIEKFFRKKLNGVYLDVGCYHPLEGNNTYLLYKKGWNGMNIDLNKTSIELFNKARQNDVNLRIAISNKYKKVKFFYRKKINMLNTINTKFANSSFKSGFKTSSIQADTLNSVLEKSKLKNKKIDFLNIDIEGNEINALKSFNFKKYSPKLICVEIHNYIPTNSKKGGLKSNPINKFLRKKGYSKVWKNEFSFIFARKL